MSNISQVASTVYKGVADSISRRRMEGVEMRAWSGVAALATLAVGIGVIEAQSVGYMPALPVSIDTQFMTAAIAPYVVGITTMVGLAVKPHLDDLIQKMNVFSSKEGAPGFLSRMLDKVSFSSKKVNDGLNSNPAIEKMMQEVSQFESNMGIFIGDENFMTSGVAACEKYLKISFERAIKEKIEMGDSSPVGYADLERHMMKQFGLEESPNGNNLNVTHRALYVIDKERVKLGLEVGSASKFLSDLKAIDAAKGKTRDGMSLG
jgi:hypothetical protein